MSDLFKAAAHPAQTGSRGNGIGSGRGNTPLLSPAASSAFAGPSMDSPNEQLAAERAAIQDGLQRTRRDQLATVDVANREGIEVALQAAARMRAQVDREAVRVALALRKAELQMQEAAQQRLAIEADARKVVDARLVAEREAEAAARARVDAEQTLIDDIEARQRTESSLLSAAEKTGQAERDAYALTQRRINAEQLVSKVAAERIAAEAQAGNFSLNSRANFR